MRDAAARELSTQGLCWRDMEKVKFTTRSGGRFDALFTANTGCNPISQRVSGSAPASDTNPVPAERIRRLLLLCNGMAPLVH